MTFEIVREVRYALRGLRRQPAFAATAVLTLAIGIGLTTAMFSVVHALLLKPLPFEDPERLMAVHLLVTDPRMGAARRSPSSGRTRSTGRSSRCSRRRWRSAS